MSETDKVFTGSIPRFYDEYMVPLLFEPYADDLAWRIREGNPASVLEIAAGTGVATRALARALPETTSIVATDLNQAMIDHAAAVGTDRPVEWRQADATKLPFGDATFEAVACQFGAMFFPDKARAFAEARRVLKPGGMLVFSVWDRIEENEFADVVTSALVDVFPNDPPRFLARTPHGYHDRATIESHLGSGGFTGQIRVDVKEARSRAPSPRIPALAYCQGSPLRNEIEAHGVDRLAEATDVAARAMERRFGRGPVDGKIRALVLTVAG